MDESFPAYSKIHRAECFLKNITLLNATNKLKLPQISNDTKKEKKAIQMLTYVNKMRFCLVST